MLKLILTALPWDSAENLARQVIENKLAACVNVIPGVVSLFFWQGQIQQESESLMLMKTSGEKEPALREFLQAHHPYEVPEILTFNAEKVNLPYLQWLKGYVEEN